MSPIDLSKYKFCPVFKRLFPGGTFLLFLLFGGCQKKTEEPKPSTPLLQASAFSKAVSVAQPQEETRYQIQIEKDVENRHTIVHILPKGSYHLNQDFPASLTLQPQAGVNLQKTVFTKGDGILTEKELKIFIPLLSAKASAELRFAVCTESTCEPVTTLLTFGAE